MTPHWLVTFASDSSLIIRGGKASFAGQEKDQNQNKRRDEVQAHDPNGSPIFPLQAVLTRLRTWDEIGSAIENFHPAYESLLVDFDPEQVDPVELQTKILNALQTLDVKTVLMGRLVEIPVIYGGEEGPDLDEVAQRTGLSAAEVVRLHTEATYDVSFLGFSPGFPYLLGLPNSLHCPRKATPRLRVAAGSVAIAGTQTGIYPEEGPGGWQIIGRTQVQLFNPANEPPTLLQPGDRLRFKPVDRQIDQPVGRPIDRPPVERPIEPSEPLLDVVSSGFLSSIQDLGRRGWTHLGISPGGAADPQALKLGNRLLGNKEGAAAIEMTMVGGRFRFLKETWIAIVGGECSLEVDGIPMAMWYSFRVARGQTLSVGSIGSGGPGAGARAYLCVRGGVEVPLLLGSRSTFVSGKWGGFCGRALQGGDRLESGSETDGVPGSRRVSSALRSLYRGEASNPVTNPVTVRVTRGPQWDWFTGSSQREFFDSVFDVTNEADRKGVRLSGAPLRTNDSRELLTEGVSFGAIQVPSSGQPLILFCEQQTTGGYPKIANIIRADAFRIGQLRPGDKIRFQEVGLEDAWRLNREREELCHRPLI